jgi:hypothetical protein
VLLGASVFAITLTAGTVRSLSEAPAARFRPGPGQPAWQMAESQHSEIHYLPELAAALDRFVQAAEQAYRQIGGRLNFVLPTKVPVVLLHV